MTLDECKDKTMVILINFYDTRIIMILHIVLKFMMMNSHENKSIKFFVLSPTSFSKMK